MRVCRSVVVVVLLAVVCVSLAHAQRRIKPPAQPESGPGGKAYSSARVRWASYGSGATAYWLFEPADPAPESAPVIVFLHGWGGIDPQFYGAWIDHIVRRGNVVVYPVYQADLRTPTAELTPNAISAIRDALGRLATAGHVRPQLDKVAVVGHSAGGNVAANVVALATEAGLPAPRALLVAHPGKSWNRAQRTAIPLGDLGRIPASTLIVAMTGDQDRLVRDVDAKRIFTESSAVPASNKDFVLVGSDDHGRPNLAANHLAPCAHLGDADALDFYAYWKLFDALCDAAFYGRNREYALGNTPQQRFMGAWSDGTPVRELSVTDAP